MIGRLLKYALWAGGIPLVLAEPEAVSFDRLTYHKAPKALPVGAVTEDWPRFLGPRHDLHSKETKLLKMFPEGGPRKVWEVERGTGHAPPVLAGTRLVMFHALNGREVIECLHPETGKRYWKFDYAVRLGSSFGIEDAPRSGPVIDGDLVFVVGVRGDLHCLDLGSGKVIWKKNLEKEYGPAPLFSGEGVVRWFMGNSSLSMWGERSVWEDLTNEPAGCSGAPGIHGTPVMPLPFLPSCMGRNEFWFSPGAWLIHLQADYSVLIRKTEKQMMPFLGEPACSLR